MSDKLAIEGDNEVAQNIRVWMEARWKNTNQKFMWESIDNMAHGAGMAVYPVDKALANELWDLSRQARARADYNEVEEVAA